MKKTIAVLLAAVLMCSLLQGCKFWFDDLPFGPAQDPTVTVYQLPTEPQSHTQTDAPDETGTEPEPTLPAGDDEALIRWQNAGVRDYLEEEPVELVNFSEMVYTHPDVEAMYAAFDDLTAQAGQGVETDRLLEGFYRVYDRYMDFYTMDSLSNIRYSLDITEPYYKDEYDFCELESPNVEEKLEALYKAFAASSNRDELEQAYFGEGFFLSYDDYEVYTNEEYLSLKKQEEELLTQYRSLLEDPMIELDGKQQSYWDLMETDNYYTYLRALQAYYNQYNPKICDIYIQLIKLRKQMAKVLDYDSYAELCYDMTYERDYTPEQGEDFVEQIRTDLVPVYLEASSDWTLSNLGDSDATQAQVERMVKSAAANIGGTVADAYRFMEAYGLYDIEKKAEKTDASFQTYLYTYEAPFVFVNSKGTSDDYTTFAHEFGHFTDSYYNYGANEDLETAETYSQAMEFLALSYTDALNAQQKDELIKSKLVDALETFVSQAAFADFEQRVYALPDDKLTVENVNEIYRQVTKDYGFYEDGFDFFYSQAWIDIMHFFEVPYYVISYCVSAETSLQVYQLEEEKTGEGVAAYFRLLDRDLSAGVGQVVKDAGLDDPFRAGCILETAEFFRDQLGLRN